MAKKTKKGQEQEFRPLVTSNSKKPLKQIFSGFEIEKRQLLYTIEGDHSKKGNGLTFYDKVLKDGVSIDQGYIKDIQVAVTVLQELGIELNDFKPNTIRIRKFGPGHKDKKISKHKYILTLKDRKETKKREVEFKISKSQFDKYWEMTEGARVYKKRLKEKIKGFTFEMDAFIDRILFIAECEVTEESELEKVPKIGKDITNDKNWSNKALSR